MTKSFDRKFLGKIAEDCESIHQHHRGHLLAVAAAIGNGDDGEGRTQLDCIDAAMDFSPKVFDVVLRERIYRRNAPLTDRTNAAFLYLRGCERKLWCPLKNALRFARKLVNNFMEDDMQKNGTMPVAAKADEATLMAIRNAGLELVRVTEAPAPSSDDLLLAVEAWVKAACRVPIATWQPHLKFKAAGDEVARRIVVGLGFDPRGQSVNNFELNDFRRFVSRECSLFLYLEWNSGGQARRAALLSLHGAGLGWWRISKGDYKAACDVAGTKSDGSAIRAIKKPKGKCNAAMYLHACETLQNAFDAETDDNAKLNAIEEFFKTVGWIGPDDLSAQIKERELTP